MKQKCKKSSPKGAKDFSKSSEGDEQQKLFQWASIASNLLHYEGLGLMFHIPNEGKRSRFSGGKMKKEGLKRGVADVCLPVPRGPYHGLFFEMKYDKKSASWVIDLDLTGKGDENGPQRFKVTSTPDWLGRNWGTAGGVKLCDNESVCEDVFITEIGKYQLQVSSVDMTWKLVPLQ